MKWPTGVQSAGISAGIKPTGARDLGVMVTASPAAWAGTFTRNGAAAACVGWCRSLLGGRVRAIVVNSGNANACTGRAGVQAVEATASAAAETLGCNPNEVLVASTGTIGVPLPVEKLVGALPHAIASTSSSLDDFADSILTTDSGTKVSSASAGKASVVGVAKGAAMLAPNMATMLAFIATDAAVAGDELQSALDEAVAHSFDRISVDACESTNDSVFLLATGATPCEATDLASALTHVCKDLAEQMVRDAEGGSRFIRIQVAGASDETTAVELGRAVAASALWRAAANGGDPNWGRVLAALGAQQRSLDLATVTISIGAETVFDRGEPVGSLDAARKQMSAGEFTVHCVVGDGEGAAEILSSDLSTEYVSLNAAGAT